MVWLGFEPQSEAPGCLLLSTVLAALVSVRGVGKGHKQEMLFVRENSRVQIAEEQVLRMQCLSGGHMEVLGFPGGSAVKNPPAKAGDGFDPWVRKIPWRREWQPTPVLPGSPMNRGAWWATVRGVAKGRTGLSD